MVVSSRLFSRRERGLLVLRFCCAFNLRRFQPGLLPADSVHFAIAAAARVAPGWQACTGFYGSKHINKALFYILRQCGECGAFKTGTAANAAIHLQVFDACRRLAGQQGIGGQLHFFTAVDGILFRHGTGFVVKDAATRRAAVNAVESAVQDTSAGQFKAVILFGIGKLPVELVG